MTCLRGRAGAARAPVFGFLFVFAILGSAAACNAPPSEEEVAGDADEALSSSCPNTVPSGITCDEQTILAAVSGPRATALNRGFAWLHASPPVPYSTGAQHAGYRQDCSGFVSMCWQTGGPGFNTGAFLAGQGKDTILGAAGSYGTLSPGDALVHPAPDAHAILFAGWANDEKTVACILQQGGTPLRDARGQSLLGNSTKFGTASASYLKCKGFVPLRSSALPADDGLAAPKPAQKPCPNPDPNLTPTGDQIACADDSCGFDTSHACTNPSDCCSNVCQDNGSGTMVCGSASQDGTATTSAPVTSSLAAGTCFRNGAYYCGNPASNLQGDPNTLYHCEGGHLKNGQVCSGGCQVSAQGIDDICNDASGTSGGTDTGTSGSLGSSDPFGTGTACIPAGVSCTPGDVCCDGGLGLPQDCISDPNADPSTFSFVCGDADSF